MRMLPARFEAIDSTTGAHFASLLSPPPTAERQARSSGVGAFPARATYDIWKRFNTAKEMSVA
jgi:hypothetical protein